MNYTEVVNLALSYSDRNDLEVADRMDDFLRVVESRINRKLKVQEMSVRSYVQTSDDKEYYTLPNDFAGLRDIEVKSSTTATGRTTLKYLNPEQLNNVNENSAGVYYTIVAGQLQIRPRRPSGEVIEIIYYRRVPPLNATVQPENWVSINYPDIYLFGLMVEISSFAKDAEAKVLWDERFLMGLNELQDDDFSSRWSGTALQVRVE